MTMETPTAGTDPETQVLTVDLGARSYEIHIGPGLLAGAGDLIGAALPGRRTVIVTDENVARLHLAPLTASLKAAGIAAQTITLPPGEGTKCFGELEKLCIELLDSGLERGDFIIAFGGGVIGDLAGFAASILRRGVALAQIPTTLLSQVDSSVGGKTGINTPQGKNLIGTFYQPSLVIADTAMLDTLPEREFRAGYAEVVKYGLINDAGFFAWLEKNRPGVFGADLGARIHAIRTSCAAKAAIVAKDEREAGARALLNLGHTFGHALEAAAGYGGALNHGEAVAIGMALAFRFSETLGLCPPDDVARLETHLSGAGLPVRLSQIPLDLPDAQGLVALMAQDKKVQDGRLTFVLARGIGKSFLTQDVPMDRLERFLAGESRS